MIKDTCFTEEWLNSFKLQPEHKRIDKIILEKMIYALHLVENLSKNKLDFIFKGGTSIVLLVKEFNRFSIDIDIICSATRSELNSVLQKVVENSRFTKFELDERRSYQSGIPKAHFAFSFNSSLSSKYTGKILLDVLMEDATYPEVIEKSIQTKWIETDEKIQIRLPSVDAIFGDKLTAFAPNTVGIPYIKNGQSATMEICKQLFDLGRIFEYLKDVKIVTQSFYAFVNKEIAYRGNQITDRKMTPETVLKDVISTCKIIAKRGKGNEDEKQKFDELQKGIRAFGTGYLMSGHFRIDEAISAAGRVAYLAAKILKDDLTPIHFYDIKNIATVDNYEVEWNFLNRLKKLSDKSGFYYWNQTAFILSNQ